MTGAGAGTIWSLGPGEHRIGSAEQCAGRLADVPPEVEWFANLSNVHTRRVYENAIRDFVGFTGIARPEEFRTVTRAHIIAWRDELARRGLMYERSLFVPERGNWKDLRVPGTTDQHFMAMFDHLADAGGSDRHPVLVGLDLLGHTYLHVTSSLARIASQNSIRSWARERSRPVSSSTRRIR